jgi:hypothetical protein
MNIDEYDFDKTAQAVFIMNPSAPTQYDTWEDLKSFMISMAHTYMHNNNSFSTGGFNLTAFDGSDGERHVRASVSGSLAYSYLFPK